MATTSRSLTGLKVIQGTRQDRMLRTPVHKFNIWSRPFQITPFLIAPVLPGETMKNLSCHSFGRSDELASEMIGWWKEYYIFYVKHSQLSSADTFKGMHLDPSQSMASVQVGTTSAWLGQFKGGINWVAQCNAAIVDAFFRDEGDDSTDYVSSDNKPYAALRGHNGFLDSAIDADAFSAAYDETVVNEAGTATVTTSDISEALNRYEWLRANGLTEAASYEDYLRTFGVSAPKEVTNRPEMLRYNSTWLMPKSAVDGTGAVSTRLVFDLNFTADKDRFFNEPGFIFGVTVARAKTYYENVQGAAVGFMDDAYAWLPAVLKDRPETSLKQIAFSGTDGVLINQTSDYVVDVRDVFVHGDEFFNHARTATDSHLVPLPVDGLATNKEFPTDAFIAELIPGVAPADQIREDGMVRMAILGTQQDYT